MIISSSCIGMDSARIYNSVRMDASATTNGGIGSFLGSLQNANSFIGKEAASEDSCEDEKTPQEKLSDTLGDIRNRYNLFKVDNTHPSKLEHDAISKIKLQCLQYLLAMLFGNKASDIEGEDMWNDYSYSTEDSNVSFSGGMTMITQEYNAIHYHEEYEETNFSTTGKVVTKDGREIDFGLSLSMSRSFTEYYETREQLTYALCDPLVINLDCNIANVSDFKFRFDLDADGTEEYVSSLAPGSAFLALDLNEDGIINDGSELFGTKSGDGFKDLSAYDLDGNGWIDEADDVFKKLKIFTVDENGNQTLLSLTDKDIGAIYLGNASTQFSLNSLKDNSTNAVIRSSGIFLYENGNVGSIQQVDLAKTEYNYSA